MSKLNTNGLLERAEAFLTNRVWSGFCGEIRGRIIDAATSKKIASQWMVEFAIAESNRTTNEPANKAQCLGGCGYQEPYGFVPESDCPVHDPRRRDSEGNQMKIHILKAWPDQFDVLLLGLKTHEFRKDDRGFKVGDELILQEFNPETERYTGRVLRRTITYIGRDGFGIPDGYAVLSIAAAESDQTAELERQNAILRKVIEEALEPGVVGIQDRSGISTPEDSEVMQLGLRIGFGALMDSASRMWAIWAKKKGVAGSEFVVGPCAAVRDAWVKKAQAALAEIKEEK